MSTRAHIRRTGFTLLEMVVSLAIFSVLVAGMASALVVAMRTVETGTGVATGSALSRDVAERISSDMRFATSVTSATPEDVTVVVPDRDGDGASEKIRYAWSGVPGVSPGPVTRQLNSGPVVTIAADVSSLEMDFSTRVIAGESAGGNGRRVLMVVGDAKALAPQEQARVSLLETWGLSIQAISASATQGEFDAAVAGADVVYIPAPVTATDTGTKLRAAPITVVNEPPAFHDELGLSATDGTLDNRSTILLVDTTDPITRWLDLVDGSSPAITHKNHAFCAASPPLVPSRTLAETIGPALVVIDQGTALAGGGEPAPAQRTFLPWGGTDFDVHELTALGRTLLYRVLADPADFTDPVPPPRVLLVVNDALLLDAQEQARKDLLESWGMPVKPITAASSQASYDAAVAIADVAYVPQHIPYTDVTDKLKWVEIGVVNEVTSLTSYFGFSSGSGTSGITQTTITDNSHEITSPFSLGPLALTTSAQMMHRLQSTIGPGTKWLSESTTARPMLSYLEVGDPLLWSGVAEGRRVMLPWGGTAFDFSQLTVDGLTMLRRSLEWAAPDVVDTGPPSGTPGILGYDTAFATPAGGVADAQIATRATLDYDATITTLNVYVSTSKKAKNVALAVYEDDAGEPGNLIVEASTVKMATKSPHWHAVAITPTTLPAGDYWLAFAYEDDNQSYYHETGGETRYRSQNVVADGFLPAWGASDNSFTIRVSIYADYTVD